VDLSSCTRKQCLSFYRIKLTGQVPQLIENYKQGSAAGVSLAFLVVWMVGDITNLIGAVWAELVPTVIALAIYFCFADTILILQCVYYNTVNARREKKRLERQENGAATEEDPLIASSNGVDEETVQNFGLPGSRRRSSASRKSKSGTSNRSEALAGILEDEPAPHGWLRNTVSVFLIILAGTAGWAIAWKAGAWKPTPIADPSTDKDMPLGAEILGYASAILYLGARLPQIAKNYKEKSCEGLSLLFFVLSIVGNLTYGAGVSETRHLPHTPKLTGYRSSCIRSRRSIS